MSEEEINLNWKIIEKRTGITAEQVKEVYIKRDELGDWLHIVYEEEDE